MKNKYLQSRLLYPAKLAFRIKGQIKIFPDKKKLREFITIKPILQETLKGFLRCEGVGRTGEDTKYKLVATE